MSHIPINYDTLSTLSSSHPANTPIYMLNLWRYRSNAVYSVSHSSLAGSPCTGREAAARYIRAIRPLLPETGMSRFLKATAIAQIVAPEKESWDDVLIVKYESLETFRSMVESEKYKEQVAPHRLAALEDMRLIALSGLEL